MFSRKLTTSIGFCSGISPRPINSYCASVRYRFAVSEAPSLEQLRADIYGYLGGFAALNSFALVLPHGGIDSTCILQALHDALALQGPLNGIREITNRVQEHQRIQSYPISPMPSSYKGIQIAILKILSIDESCVSDLSSFLFDKCLTTFLSDIRGIVNNQSDWVPKVEELCKGVNSFLRICWLKAIGGAWTTITRMHESIKWPCVFGCIDCQDEIRHYMQCHVLWQLAREALKLSEEYFSLGHRLCFIECSLDMLRLLAFSHLLYHSLKNDIECVNASGINKYSHFI